MWQLWAVWVSLAHMYSQYPTITTETTAWILAACLIVMLTSWTLGFYMRVCVLNTTTSASKWTRARVSLPFLDCQVSDFLSQGCVLPFSFLCVCVCVRICVWLGGFAGTHPPLQRQIFMRFLFPSCPVQLYWWSQGRCFMDQGAFWALEGCLYVVKCRKTSERGHRRKWALPRAYHPS